MEFTVNYKKLFDTIVADRESISTMVSKSYDEITRRISASSAENIQGLKLLSESSRELKMALEDLEADNDMANARMAVLRLISYLRISYILLGGQR